MGVELLDIGKKSRKLFVRQATSGDVNSTSYGIFLRKVLDIYQGKHGDKHTLLDERTLCHLLLYRVLIQSSPRKCQGKNVNGLPRVPLRI